MLAFIFWICSFIIDDQKFVLLNAFGKVAQHKASVVYLEKAIEQFPQNNTSQAYKAAALCLKANETFFPLDKLKYCKKGLSELNAIIETEPKPEFYYLRYVIEYNVPKTLGLSKHLKNDETILKQYAQKNNDELSQFIVGFFEENSI